ncbi:MAG: cupin domain-containing protein [Polaromonas sp.]|uniref:cupin domain-containing protein n=1 Tax=Polaromonas sp. TaxID=1869339 RepID=UPI00181694DE|nr:cupin domain-containing protein [Polaromonas sp.]MBA3594236.1 cupin domain-containing protein [Polaromonas sp.]
MALTHAQPLDVISIRPLAARIPETKTHSLLKTDQMQLMRLVLVAGQTVPEHQVAGEITLLCLEGRVLVNTPGRQCRLGEGDLVVLPAHEPHALEAQTDSSLLATLLRHHDTQAV